MHKLIKTVLSETRPSSLNDSVESSVTLCVVATGRIKMPSNFQRRSGYTTLLTTSVLSHPVRVFLYKYHTIDKILWRCHLFTAELRHSFTNKTHLSSPRASGEAERLERVVQFECAAPRMLRRGRERRAGTGRGTAPQHHGYVALPWRQSPRTGRRPGAGRDTAPQHYACVARPWRLLLD